ncbi:MAG: S9 family peptidase [Candidatus Eremiobacteraeota bacterium]|nr:S9 family peptidase [Candidatus Eremiobacteraeota bacterium]
MRVWAHSSLLASAGLFALTLPIAGSARGLTFEDLRRIVSVSSPQISPDGSRIVFVRATGDYAHDRTDTTLVLVNTASHAQRELTHERISVHAPRWSPDGARIAYLASPERGKPAQLYVLPMDGGDSLKVTKAVAGVQDFAWRPDSHVIAYTTADKDPAEKFVKRHLDAVVVTDQDYLTTEGAQPVHIWSVDADGANTVRLSSGAWSVTGTPVWTPDGRRIVYQRQPDAIFAHFVSQTTYVHDIDAKTDVALGTGVDENPILSHDGTMLATSLPRHGTLYLQRDLSVRPLSGGSELFNSQTIDRNAHWYAWLPHDSELLFGASDGVRDRAWQIDRNGHASRLDLGDVDFSSAGSIAENGAVAFVGASPSRPGEIYVLPAGARVPVRLTDNNAWLSTLQVAPTKPFQWQTDLSVAATGALTYPVDYVAGKRYPLVLDIHGGPVSTSVWDFDGLEPGLAQVLAGRGYFVFRPNYRGSDNSGDAFLQAIVGDVTSGPGRDNLAAVDALQKTGMIDPSRIFVSGWSGGGLQTSWLIGHASYWRAAVMGAAVTDWYEQALLADIGENFALTFFDGTGPFTPESRAKYDAESPLTFVSNVKTPTLILSDTRDQRVPVSQAYQFYHALRDRGVPVAFTAFPRYGHFATDPVGREQTLRAWAGWFDRWMK